LQRISKGWERKKKKISGCDLFVGFPADKRFFLSFFLCWCCAVVWYCSSMVQWDDDEWIDEYLGKKWGASAG